MESKIAKIIPIIVLSLSVMACQFSPKESSILGDILNDSSTVELFSDSCTNRWEQNWVLDGTRAVIQNTDQGMAFYAGKENGNDTCHAVLWTKESFKGDIMIQYEYTRLDSENRNVNILYIQATGEKPYSCDIHKWSKEREVPSMFKYFHNMNTLHISYAAYRVLGSDSHYVRARRYMPLTKTLKATNFGNSFENTGMFETNVPHQITVVKKGFDLYMHVKNSKQEKLFTWNYKDFPLITEGYIGLRHMYTRAARYKDFKVYQLTN